MSIAFSSVLLGIQFQEKKIEFIVFEGAHCYDSILGKQGVYIGLS